MPSRRSVLAAPLAGLAAPAFAQPARARTLRFVPQANLTSLDPIWTTAAVTENHGWTVFDTLYGMTDDLKVQPQMAEGHTVSDDGRTWLIRLREGLRWHDGEPVRAQDCAPSLARWSRRDTFGQSLAAVVDAWEAADDRTIRIRLKSKFPMLVDALAKPAAVVPFMMPERIARTDPFQQMTEVIGSGPYRFLKDEYISGSRAAYAKFDGYVPRQEAASRTAGGKVAHFERVEWTIIPDSATASAALQSGEIDWWEQVNADLAPLLRRSRGVQVEVLNTLGYIGVARFNCLHPPFNNPAIRRALLLALNQEDYLRGVTGNDPSAYRVCASMWPCGTPYESTTGNASLTGPRDLERVKGMIRDAGYRGEKIVIINPTDFPTIGPFGQVTADLLRRLGMNADLVETDWGSVVQRRASKSPPEQGGWSIFHTWWPSLSIINPAVSATLRGQGDSGWFGWYANPRVEDLARQWLVAETEAEQKRLADGIQQESFENVPVLPLGQFFINTAYRSGLSGFVKGTAAYPWNIRRA
ncbi:ABC transporter substrate-binding protein [Neoroseomonas oryzicola]|uniref:ABC transporter substrate-binding protein n=1 Tax=Neoroseomonas oryzicola TaxID=535904 RepID=A0A9X9WNT4_9PROT|nr:ABC transporter substrate-binding protein [Neoroseomonas oryzicola]MBR0661994.1 ABC transporter substrate-binding protein [Neoroseomonas oryzicola]NKE16801.1 ABC transporter substrate-binding protein [Neoroseomonas oryzicola]